MIVERRADIASIGEIILPPLKGASAVDLAVDDLAPSKEGSELVGSQPSQ